MMDKPEDVTNELAAFRVSSALGIAGPTSHTPYSTSQGLH